MSISCSRISKSSFIFREIVKLDRTKSWEICHNEFVKFKGTTLNNASTTLLSLHLAGFLASWGMYTRKSNLMLSNSYMVHYDLIERLMKREYNDLFDIKDNEDLFKYKSEIRDVYCCIKDYYEKLPSGGFTPSTTLVTKIMLGVYGCIPALDTFVRTSLMDINNKGISTIDSFIDALYLTIKENPNLDNEIISIQAANPSYTYMRILDLLLWDHGQEVLRKKKNKKRN